jgi:glycosyltransferase involved in cell wall biosynthesis
VQAAQASWAPAARAALAGRGGARRGGGAPARVRTLNAVPELPSLTIITPCLNAVATLPATLASVRAQAYPGLEHIVVDGGSTDGTLDVLRAAEGVRWISEPDRGLSHALNKGITMATGDVIGELNADDVYERGALAAVGAALRDRPDAVWLTGYCRIIDGDGREIRQPVTAYKNWLLRRYSLGLSLTHNFVSAPATFFRRAALAEAGGFDERYRISVDYDLQLRIARRHDPLVLPRYLASFRMAEGSLSMSGFRTQFREHAEQARRHGAGHRTAVAANQVISAGIVGAYELMRRLRALRAA